MTFPTYPGVYVKEVSSGVKPISGASTSTAAFFGEAERGPILEPVKIYNFTEFQTIFGGFYKNLSYLSYSVYLFFKNGGSQCYVIRVAGLNAKTATITIKDRAENPVNSRNSLTISACSPGKWGMNLVVQITKGKRDPENEFNLSVTNIGSVPLETEKFENLSMIFEQPNFVELVISRSKLIKVEVNRSNGNTNFGKSIGKAAPLPLPVGKTCFRINLNGDGFQEINLSRAVGTGEGKVADLSSPANIQSAIQYVVRRLTPLLTSTDSEVFELFTCSFTTDGKLVLQSGQQGVSSSVEVIKAEESAEDAASYLKLGRQNDGIEIKGCAIQQPILNNNQNDNKEYFIGKDTKNWVTCTPGNDGEPFNDDSPFVKALHLLNPIEDVSIIAIPGKPSPGLASEVMNYCENRILSDCFYIGEVSLDHDEEEEIKDFCQKISNKNSYGAIYAPWVYIPDPTGVSKDPIPVPPSGFLAGLFAKTDAQRGVWKAPAGTGVALAGSVGLNVIFTDTMQGNLNQKGINCIRQFASSGIVSWGARTITSDTEWLYIPVRRMAIFLRVSIYRGIQWAVFEPNDEPLWASLRRNIEAFMMTLYRKGAFQGSSPSEAFFVKCDSETTTQADIDLGIVNMKIGFAPLKPAEFIMVEISQKAGGN